MHVAILAAAESWYLKDLRRAAAIFAPSQGAATGKLGCQITPLDFTRLAASVSPLGQCIATKGDSPFDLAAADALLVRTMPPGSLEQVVFRMDLLAQVEQAGCLVLNPPKAIETAVDKYLTTARLQAAGLATPRTIVCQGVDEAMQAFETLGEDVVLKPLFGAEGRGIARLNDEAMALRAFKLLADLRAVMYLQEFVPHEGCDLRILVLGDRLYGMKRCNLADWRTNVSRGAHTEPLVVTDELAHLARTAASAVGAPLAGVDLLPARDGRLLAIEVNAVPGWQALARTLQVDIALEVLRYVAERT